MKKSSTFANNEYISKQNSLILEKSKKKAFWKTNFTGWLMVASPFVGFLLFAAIPMFYGLYISFFSLHSTVLEFRVFVGFENYLRIFKSPMFYQSLGNTLYYTVGIFLNMALALFLAQRITSHKIFGDRVWRIILFLPQVCSMVAVTVMWTWILNADQGVINTTLLKPFGVQFLPSIKKEHFMPSIFLMGLWRDGVNIILLQSALVNVNHSLQEAARLDGANEYQVFWKITFQAVLPTLFYMLITNFIVATQEMALFSIISSGGQGPGGAAVTVAYYIVRMTGASIMTDGYGMSSALSWIFAIILVVLTRFLMWLNNRFVCYD